MGPKDETSAKPAEIGNALVEALGFEPADGKKLGRSKATDVSDQISDVGFAVTEAFDDEAEGLKDGTSKTVTATADATEDAVNGNGEGIDSLLSELDADSPNGSNETTADPSKPGTTSKSNGSGNHRSKRGKSKRSKMSTSSKAGSNGTSNDGDSTTTSTDNTKADADAKLREIVDTDPNDTVVMPGPPAEEVSAAKSSRSKRSKSKSAKDNEDLVESLVTAGTMAGATTVPTSPPIADVDGDDVAENETATEAVVEAKADPAVPTSPAVTGEHKIVEIDGPDVERPIAERTVVADSRSVIDMPRSVSDMFSGGITGRRRLQARKVRRVIRHIDPWSVLTFSVLFHLCLFAALLLASVLVWNVADEAGTIENVESFIRELGDYETFEIDGEAIFRAAVAIAGIMTLAASVLVVLLTVMFNLLSDLLGGVRITVIEEETVRVKPKKD